MVYDALGGRMGGVLHALALTTARRPNESTSRAHRHIDNGPPHATS